MLIFHIFACVWIVLGNCNEPDNLISCDGEEGWIFVDAETISRQNSGMVDFYIYVSSLYFISTTSTTVGYGDFKGRTKGELIFLIFLEFSGICTFSIITGLYKQLIRVKNIQKIVEEKSQDITYYLQ
jgi:hypothetical protein